MVAPLIVAGLIGAGASLISGWMQSNAANNAAAAQDAVGQRALDLQAKTIEQSRKDSLPWMMAGQGALQQYLGEMGLSDKGADGKAFQSQFTASHGYDFAVKEGEKGAVQNMAALGMKGSGAALKALTKFRQGLATGEYNNYMTRLGNIATGGQQQTSDQNSVAMQGAGMQSNTLSDIGAARASGYTGQANAWSGAMQGIGNTAGYALGRLNNNWQQNALSWG
jgi:hypothetical protein